MSEYFYGISCRQLFQLEKIAVQSPFDGVEFPGEALECRPIMRKLTKGGKYLAIRELCSTALAHALPEAGGAVYRDFNRLFFERAKLANSYGISQVGMDFDLNMALNDHIYEEKLRKILLTCFGILDKFHLKMVIGCRIPGGDSSKLLAFKHRLIYSGIDIQLNFYPHEPEAVDSLQTQMVNLFFYRDNWRINFYPEHGNYINLEVLNLIRSSAKNGAKIWFSPGNQVVDDEYLTSLHALCTKGIV